MKIGIAIEETWDFFTEIFEVFSEQHQVIRYEPTYYSAPIFSERVNRMRKRRDLNQFLQKCDVVFFEWASGILAEASHLPKTCGIVTRLHRYEMYEWADEINWTNVDRIILVSEAKRNEFLSKFPQLSQKVEVIPEAVSLDRFKVSEKEYAGDIGTMARFQPRKRIYELMLTFYELSKQSDDFHLHIGGGRRPRYAEYYDIVLHQTWRFGLEDKVTFYGTVTEPEAWYQGIDIFISNSFSEGLQVSPMEAIATGCYCLSHDWDGADELLPEKNIYRTDSELLSKILEYHNLDVSQKGQERALLRDIVTTQFDVDNTRKDILAIVETVGLQQD